MAKTDLTAQRLRELLHYDPETGVFIRLARTSNRIKAGDIAGRTRPNGYRVISVESRLHLAHRLAWLYVTGAWPAGHIDHVDGDPRNNAFANLRDVSRHVNMQNRRRASRDNAAGYLGVTWDKNKWAARIYVAGRNVTVGRFGSPEEAHAAYLEAKRRLHPGGTV